MNCRSCGAELMWDLAQSGNKFPHSKMEAPCVWGGSTYCVEMHPTGPLPLSFPHNTSDNIHTWG